MGGTGQKVTPRGMASGPRVWLHDGRGCPRGAQWLSRKASGSRQQRGPVLGAEPGADQPLRTLQLVGAQGIAHQAAVAVPEGRDLCPITAARGNPVWLRSGSTRLPALVVPLSESFSRPMRSTSSILVASMS